MEDALIMGFKSHIAGKNADVEIYPDRIEWALEGKVSKTRLVAGLATAGVSLAATGVRKKQAGAEVIAVKSISSVTTDKDGLRFTKVKVITSGNVIDFRVGHDEAKQIKDTLTQLMLGSHPTQATPASPPPAAQLAPPLPPPPGASPAPPPPPAAGGSVADEIKKLVELRDLGALSDEEFEAQKARLLG